MASGTLARSVLKASSRWVTTPPNRVLASLAFGKYRCFHNNAPKLKIKPYMLADIGEGITECRLVQWFVKPGDRVDQFEAICEVQSDKASVDITSRYDGTVVKLRYDVDDMAIVGQPIMDIDVDETGEETAEIEQQAEETQTSEAAPAPAASPDKNESRQVPLTPNEMQMFKTMTDSLRIPHFGFTHAVDVTDLGVFRTKANEAASRKITPLAIIMKAVSEAFTQHPRINARLSASTPETAELAVSDAHNFGIAVDTPRGLLVPVVKNVEQQSVQSLAAEIDRLASLAKQGRIAPSDLHGATFTVSNIGSIGGAAVNPVIVPPMTAIVAIGKMEDKAVFATGDDGQEGVVRRRQVVLSWSADHRVHDGAAVARCAEAVSAKLESKEWLEAVLE